MRRHAGREHGFTLVEMLVVVLIIGILAAIALPQFLGSSLRAQDLEAQSHVHTAAKTMATVKGKLYGATDTTAAELIAAEPALAGAINLQLSAAGQIVTISADSRSGARGGGPFRLVLVAEGRIQRTCGNPGNGLCRTAADAAGNSW